MKNKKVIVWVLVVLIVSGLGFKWFGIKMDRVDLGLAKPNFPYIDYTGEELEELFPQIRYANVPTRVTPEETYAKFRQALKENDLEMAIEQIGKESGKYEDVVETLTDFYNNDKFIELFSYYPKEINQYNMYESIAQYEFEYYSVEYKQNLIGSINFIKNSNGDWKLSNL